MFKIVVRVIVALFAIAKTWKQPKYSLTDEEKRCGTYLYNGIWLSHKKYKMMPFVSNMDRPRDHTKWSKPKTTMILLIGGI